MASASASEIISAQVCGGFGTRSDRYQSNWVLLLCGAAYSLPFHSAVSKAGASVPFSTDALSLPVHGRIQPAWANSAAQVTSRTMTSMLLSCAASRRTSCWR